MLNANEAQKEALQKAFGFNIEGKKIHYNPNKFARTIKKHTVIRQLKNNELAVYNYDQGVYEINSEEIIQKMVKYAMNLTGDLWNPYYASLAIQAIRHDTFEILEQLNAGEYINLQNGILDLTTYELFRHNPRYLCTVQLPFAYEESKQLPPVFARYLDDITCGDSEMQVLLQEVIGYCLSNSTSAEKAFFLTGSGRNGKSVLARLIQLLVGEGNYSTTSLSALNGAFGLTSLINSNVNVSAENGGKVNTETFKSLVSGDVQEINIKYKAPLTMKLNTKLVFLFNELPDSSDLTYGFFRKILLIPFRHTVPQESIDTELIKKLEMELPAIFYWAIEGLKRLQNNKYQFSPSKVCEEALKLYSQSLNPTAVFFEETFELAPEKSLRKKEIYSAFVDYCGRNSIELLNCQKFWRYLKSYFETRNYAFRIKKIKGYDFIEGIRLKP